MTDDELWASASALWRRECERLSLDPDDERLVDGLEAPLCAPEPFAVIGAPTGSDGFRWLADRYLEGIARSERVAAGRFYTPRNLAASLAERALETPLPASGIITDPACGAGSLLCAVVDRLIDHHPAESAVQIAVQRVRGTDLDPIAVRLCELAVRLTLLRAWMKLPDRDRPRLPTFARVADGFDDDAAAAVVIANPPFGRCGLSPEARAAHARVLYGHAHWPTLFLHASVKRLVEGGTAAFVLPASLVGGLYYQRLRGFLMDEAPPHWLSFIEDRSGIFGGGVLQEALLGTFRRGAAPGDVTIEKLPTGGVRRSALTISASRWEGERPWLIPRSDRDVPLIDLAMRRARRLHDQGWRISTGPLVWNRHREQLFDEPSDERLPVLWSSDLRNGLRHLEPRTGRYIEPRAGQEWLVLREPSVLVQRTTAPEQPRRLVAALLTQPLLDRLGGAVVVENHLNVCTWDGTGELTPDRLHVFLMSDEADRLYRCMSGSVAVSAFELGAIPLPDPEELRVDAREAA